MAPSQSIFDAWQGKSYVNGLEFGIYQSTAFSYAHYIASSDTAEFLQYTSFGSGVQLLISEISRPM